MHQTESCQSPGAREELTDSWRWPWRKALRGWTTRNRRPNIKCFSHRREFTMKTFDLHIDFGRSNIKTRCASDKIDEVLVYWNARLDENNFEGDEQRRSKSSEFIVDKLDKDLHHNNQEVSYDCVAAALWLIATGPLGSTAMPFLRQGGVTVMNEITEIGERKYNFRTKFDEKTSASLQL
jgi:hypothetical protein